jgi:hypothetical protein
MRYFRSVVFDVGLAVTLVGVLSALWVARDIIAFTLQFLSRQWSREGGTAAAIINLSGFVLATLLAMIGLAILVVGVVRARRGA